MTFEGLVPEDFDEFRSVKFWDGFFQKRNRKVFEWYGDWKQLQPLVWGACARPNKHTLMLGCGNSDISAQMYDAGCHSITNIDFSKVCIKEMLMKNLRQRPQMKWMVMDMTQLTFKAGSFHIAFDKGALDALMGEDTEAASCAGSKLLSEVQRVLDESDGQYLCVTLGQPHVLSKLLASFGMGWSISIDRVPPSPDMASSPLQPLLVTVARHHQAASHLQQQQQLQLDEIDGQVEDADCDDEKAHGGSEAEEGQTSGVAPAVQLSFGPEAGVVNSEQLDDVIKVVEQENRLRASGGRAQPARQPTSAAKPVAAQLGELEPGRRCVVPLPQHGASTSGTGVLPPCNSEDSPPGRFTAAVIDVEAAPAKRAVRDCAVFIVPQGREHEWLFASPEGQGQVAQGCSAKRVIVVSLNRGHVFGSLKAVQGELSPLVVDLAPIASRQLEAAIPFMTTQEGIGSRNVLEKAESALTGRISVEDVTVQSEGDGDTVLRRMVFTSNRNLVQSEAVLCTPSHSSQSGGGASATAAAQRDTDAAVAGSRPSSKKGTAKGKATKQKAKLDLIEGMSAEANGGTLLAVDHSQLACDYHKGIVAGLSLIQPHLSSLARTGPQKALQQQHTEQQPMSEQGSQIQGGLRSRPQALVVGLGGGGLPVFLNKHCDMDAQSVELDPVVVDLARRHFGFVDSTSLQAKVGDGLEAVAQLAHRLSSDSNSEAQSSVSCGPAESQTPTPDSTQPSQSLASNDADNNQSPVSNDGNHSQSPVSTKAWHSQHVDLLVVDAGSGDASVAMSCPPAAFLEPEFLGYAKQVLSPGGMLVINCVSRAEAPYKAAVKALQAVFEEVYELDVDEDVNKVLFALPQPVHMQPGPAQSKASNTSNKKKKAGKAAQVAKLPQIDGSAGGVKLLAPRLHNTVQETLPQCLSDLEAMLQHLSLAKQ